MALSTMYIGNSVKAQVELKMRISHRNMASLQQLLL